MNIPQCVSVSKQWVLVLWMVLLNLVKTVNCQIIESLPEVEVLSEAKDFQIPCKADFVFNQVYSFNWLFNGTFIHPSLNPGVTILTDGSLNIDKVQPTHTGGYICYVTSRRKNLTSLETQLVVREKTTPKRRLPNLSVLEGSGDVYMRCSFTYDFALHDSLEISWIFNNGEKTSTIRPNKTGRVQGKAMQGRALILTFPYRKVSTTYLTLTIEDVSLKDDGWYTCLAKTRLDSAVTPTGRLDVKKKTEIIKNPAHVQAVQGGEATLLCIVSIDSSLLNDAEIYWTHNGRMTQEVRTKLEVFGHEKQKITHKITDVTSRDKGRYQCHIITPFDTKKSKYARLEITAGTYFLEEPESAEASFGGNVEFRCIPHTDPSLKSNLVVSWKRNGQPITVESNKFKTHDSGTVLIISDLNSEDSGEISCFVKTDIDSLSSQVATLLVLRPTKIVEQSPGVKDVPEGSDITLECRVETDPKLQDSLKINWLYNNQELHDDSKVDPQGHNHVDIKIKSASKSDTGFYQCVASSSKDEDRSEIVQVIVRQKTIIESSQQQINALQGESATVKCNHDTDPELQDSLTVDWFKDAMKVKDDDRISKKPKELIINNLLVSDTGSYKCKVSTSVESVESEPLDLKIYKNSILTNQPENKKIFAGSELILTCEAEIDTSLTAQGVLWTWFRNSDIVKEETGSSGLSNFVLANTNKEDSALYHCKLTTNLEEIESSQVSVRVYSPTKITKYPENIHAVHGQSIEFECEGQVDPILTAGASISWFKDGKLVSAKNPISSVLHLEYLSAEAAGQYTCKIKTEIGEVSALAELFLKEKTSISSQPFKGDKLEGESVLLQCEFETDADLEDKIKVTWFKDNSELEGQTDSELVLDNLKYEDTGDYKCLVETDLDKAEQVHTLVVYKKTAIEVPEVFSAMKSVTGKSVELECTVFSDPKLSQSLNITWLKDQEIIGPGEVVWGSDFDATSTLKLENINGEDSGKYACSASTWRDSSMIDVGALTVWKATTFITKPSTIEVVHGAKAMLDCEVDVDPELADSLDVSWMKDGAKIEATQGGEGNFRIEANKSLTIFSSDEKSAGSYSCQVKTDLDTESLVQILKVLEKSRVVVHPRHQTVKQEASFVLECAISTDPELLSSLGITWRQNKIEMAVTAGKQNKELGNSSLSLVATDATVGGRYDCVAVTRLDTVTSRPSYIKVDVRVNCILSQWEDWGECSVSCGGGNRTRVKTVVQEAKFGGEECADERQEIEQCNQHCCVPVCDDRASFKTSDGQPCGYCVCKPGYAGPGTLCGDDSDADGWPDVSLPCNKKACKEDNCRNKPNSGQEDSDNDGVGDDCDPDADGDGILNVRDNCPLFSNIDQIDIDRDSTGDACDNCINVSNKDQENVDGDEFGDACDADIDNDEVLNAGDNCPDKLNPNQADEDNDGVGDICDNCPDTFNPDQEDYNHNLIGDACDDGLDDDLDGVPDNTDNCPFVVNADQLDADLDGIGDDCDPDADNDGIFNKDDNCPLIPNRDQLDDDSDGIGDVCFRNYDGDSTLDEFDTCPRNAKIDKTDFRAIQPISMGANTWGQPEPQWEFRNEGQEIQQLTNSAPGLAIGVAKMAGVDFEGTFYVGPHEPLDNDFIGFIFSFQDSSNFYLVMSARDDRGLVNCQGPCHQGNWQIKRVNSETGPYLGTVLSDAIRKQYTVPGETTLLWQADRQTAGGWKEGKSYRYNLIHRPKIGLIRLWLYEGAELIADSGNIIDDGDGSLRGGRLGVYCDSQEQIIYSALSYKCKSDVSEEVFNQLPFALQQNLVKS